jgi:hypothetical protein
VGLAVASAVAGAEADADAGGAVADAVADAGGAVADATGDGVTAAPPPPHADATAMIDTITVAKPPNLRLRVIFKPPSDPNDMRAGRRESAVHAEPDGAHVRAMPARLPPGCVSSSGPFPAIRTGEIGYRP